ncbi:type II toxin-antitoxin system RelE/ParE family toxin [Burkholderia stagnalis]|uniref:type II toxin-antitoxin system RelE/ParE family toxin n=1 Tax=Burkholderia stagnalis TaxID=1503054 RepID=UPI000F5B9C4F|nr:type II toxin-antitoxin system RelE/ParE family toxin [Burkholderia stagnalis]RQQ00435.1 type II toxin-antitoxin system RelE/ParE family toxin [Burkholderia stagnalis]RQY68669.1 type II toxin-antitoxin system RelE/ParE family toxin [Burkholderia stagnalis]
MSGPDYHVVFSPEARDQLAALEDAIAAAGAPRTAAEYVDAIVTFCEQLSRFPARGVPRDDLLAGLRVTHYRGRTMIAYRISDDQVAILGVYYGGQDYVADFRASFDD